MKNDVKNSQFWEWGHFLKMLRKNPVNIVEGLGSV